MPSPLSAASGGCYEALICDGEVLLDSGMTLARESEGLKHLRAWQQSFSSFFVYKE